jgi:alcohol dehydrogenase
MKALVYHGPGRKSWETVPDPSIQKATDAIVSIDAVTICGTDLHILKGDVPETKAGTILGRLTRRSCRKSSGQGPDRL